MPEINLAREKFRFENLQPGDCHTIERRGWLADVLGDSIFNESEKRDEHHALVDALHEAEAALRNVGPDIQANHRAWLEASANGGGAPEKLDGAALMQERSEAVNVARLRLWRWADLVIGEQRLRMNAWLHQLVERDQAADEKLAAAQRIYDDALAEKRETAGQRAYVEAMRPLPPNRSHGIKSYDLCTQPPEPPPVPPNAGPVRTGMEPQIHRAGRGDEQEVIQIYEGVEVR
jgi:hypothetical protein